ncbi:MAG: ASKHA domain-containing protein [Treponema sp.]|jgi:uncharacterized 2Fe-2S/4Fe-4S cluster protein (DUF4445 family)|nr:ASKHA domain-containing protein [Treponema sp.]
MEIHLDDRTVTCEVKAGESLLAALIRAGIAVSAPCGGRGLCGKCKIRLLSGRIEGGAPVSGMVCSCRAIPVSDVKVALVPDEEVFINETSAPGRGNPPHIPERAGVALDIGTTTVSAELINLDTAESIDVVSLLNDQKVFGADVINRINAAKNGKTGELFRFINRQTEKILGGFINKYDLKRIEKLAVSGNTTMLHLFVNTDPSGMGEIPFTPVFLNERSFPGAEFALSAEEVLLLPSISAFIGSDIVSGLAVLDIVNDEGPSLLIDIGTNGEMALFHRGRILCCSTAAGPAFEGAEISCGIGSVKGAVNRVGVSGGTLTFTTIGGAPPVGICGCGLIDAVALMLKQEKIDESGAFCGGASPGFFITPDISINNRDIRQFQLAKSAIMSGIKILCKNAGLELTGIKNVFIAGGLGFFIDKQNAASAGLLPKEFLDRIFVCGNLSLKGAAACLTRLDFLSACKKIIEKCEVTELAADPSFTDEFVENMLF